MLFKTSSILAALLIATLCSFAQDDKKEMGSFSERLEYGGNVSLQISNRATFLGASPFIGYRLTQKLSAGIGYSAFYIGQNFFGQRIGYGFHGPNAYTRLVVAEETIIADQLFVTSEFHYIFNQALSFDPTTESIVKTSVEVPVWFVGAGGYMNLGGRVRAGLTVMIDLIGEGDSPWPNPFISGGIIIQ